MIVINIIILLCTRQQNIALEYSGGIKIYRTTLIFSKWFKDELQGMVRTQK